MHSSQEATEMEDEKFFFLWSSTVVFGGMDQDTSSRCLRQEWK